MKNLHTELTHEQITRCGKLTVEEFLIEYFGAERVMFNYDSTGEIEVTFSSITADEDDGEKECSLDIASLKPGRRLENIKDLTRAMSNTFPETGYPK